MGVCVCERLLHFASVAAVNLRHGGGRKENANTRKSSRVDCILIERTILTSHDTEKEGRGGEIRQFRAEKMVHFNANGVRIYAPLKEALRVIRLEGPKLNFYRLL